MKRVSSSHKFYSGVSPNLSRHWRQLSPCDTWIQFFLSAYIKFSTINIYYFHKEEKVFSKHLFELNDVKGTCYMPGIVVGTLVNLRQLILIPVLGLKKLILSQK